MNLATPSSNSSATPSIESSVDEGLDDECEKEEGDMEAIATPSQKKRKTQKGTYMLVAKSCYSKGVAITSCLVSFLICRKVCDAGTWNC